ncbi:MAG: GTPase HflX [Omnitrophica bacterium RIFCSPLOWO2_12_FULL_50_11]|nr:MAG: GTPase HflX [Omnitrophica bacterium RIFCSPLOWO2_12_FULL_50_11]
MARDQAFLVVVRFKRNRLRSVEDLTAELSELTRSAGGRIVGHVTANIDRPTPDLFIARGKLFEIREQAERNGANLLIFNVDLSAVQGRNIEQATGLRAVDRTGIILDIFARRAQSHAGRLQVELAQLNYLLPRLIGHGVIMSRLGGGIGTRGPGEQKLEVDRRKIRERIVRLKGELDKLKIHQRVVRSSRKRKDFSVVALIGYTNAGKTTLLNELTGAAALVEDKFFATLDPTTRVLHNKGGTKILVTDTVGFLRDLPHTLIESFRATLEEVTEADVLVHVLDIADSACEQHYGSVGKVLEDLNAIDRPTILALNKVDLLDDHAIHKISEQFPDGILISAQRRTSLDCLVDRILARVKEIKTAHNAESFHRAHQ